VNTPRLRATYRLQLHRGFDLASARRLVPYLARLGISHLYASPVLRSRPGSTHGYDVVDPTRLDPELGSDRDWDALAETLRAHAMGLVLDIVPNHMGVGSDNPFWDDLFANGPASRYAAWFDVDWTDPRRGVRGRVLVPILDDELDAVIARGAIALALDEGRLRVRYGEDSFPLDPATLPSVLEGALAVLARGRPRAEGAVRALRELTDRLRSLPPRLTRSPRRLAIRQREAPALLRRLETLAAEDPGVRAAIDEAARDFTLGAAGHARLKALLDAQVYALAHWRRAAHEINYRRFFDINELVALRTEDPQVFGATHRRVIQWVKDGQVDGLRVDHVDGLLDPEEYLVRLRSVTERVRGGVPIVVEKILSDGERLRESWPVDGTTGYEFLNELEAVFIDPVGREVVEAHYRRRLGIRRRPIEFAEVAYRAKVLVLRSALDADVRRLARLLAPIAARDPRTAACTPAQLREGIVQFIAALPVYRTYLGPRQTGVHPDDARVLERAFAVARERGGGGAGAVAAVLGLLADVLFLRDVQALEPAQRAARFGFIQRLQQTSAAAAAKGVEDTALYRYVPLASLNEVGGAPDREIRGAVERLHRANAERAARWPRQLLCTSTHDTKRSADVRARLDVLSELPVDWAREVDRWREAMREARSRLRGRPAPDAQTELLLFQTLVGVWPLHDPDPAERAALRERVSGYLLKAVREAKARTSWTDPDPSFEDALARYVDALFEGRSGVLEAVAAFARRLARPGMWNALARTLVHCTAPGTPDVYEGDEVWNFSLVDPDNRRSVDFAARETLLAALEEERRGGGELPEDAGPVERQAAISGLVANPEDGRIKLHVIRRALAARRRHPELFSAGAYEPVWAEGARATHVVAFLRRHGRSTALSVVPRLTVALGAGAPVGEDVWGDTRLTLPDSLSQASWRRTIGSGRVSGGATGHTHALRVADLLAVAPVELLLAVPEG
jgi:(1->4)-alpha-D-glucan 1-alpha-D-glucosylmutase